jgi:hypothetical protein
MLVVVGVQGPAVVPDAATGAEAATQAVHDVLADRGSSRRSGIWSDS